MSDEAVVRMSLRHSQVLEAPGAHDRSREPCPEVPPDVRQIDSLSHEDK